MAKARNLTVTIDCKDAGVLLICQHMPIEAIRRVQAVITEAVDNSNATVIWQKRIG